MPSITLREIKKLSVAERIELAEKIWESIPEHSEELYLTDVQKNELNRRLDAIKNKTAKFTTWPLVRAKLHERRLCPVRSRRVWCNLENKGTPLTRPEGRGTHSFV
jgi:putative addiction module component (TIGR02574 family)